MAHGQTKRDMLDSYGVGGGLFRADTAVCKGQYRNQSTKPERSGFDWFDLFNHGDNRVSDSRASLTVRRHQSWEGWCLLCPKVRASLVRANNKKKRKKNKTKMFKRAQHYSVPVHVLENKCKNPSDAVHEIRRLPACGQYSSGNARPPFCPIQHFIKLKLFSCK